MNNISKFTLGRLLLCVFAGVGIWFVYCDITSPWEKDEPDIRGSYLMVNYCFVGVSAPSGKHVSIDSLLSVAECTSGQVIFDHVNENTSCSLSMSTIIITDDSLVRFGYHCSGDSSGSTRVAYGYVFKDGKLTGDSLSGISKIPEGEKTMKTLLTKNDDESIVITQVGAFTSYEEDSTYHVLYKSTFKKSHNVCYHYNDVPTCFDNYEPWFPIPVW